MSAAIEQRNQDATCYCGNLDEAATEELLWELMIQAGPVVNVHMPKDKVTNTHQGYGFVEFRSEEDAEYAIKILNMVKLFGKPLRVNKASSDRKAQDVGANLFIGQLDPEVDEKLLYDTFSAFGFITNTPKVMRDPETGASKGYGFVSYDGFEASDLAIECMNGQFLCNRQIVVQYAFKRDSHGERHGSLAERLLAANNPLRLKPHTMFASQEGEVQGQPKPPSPPPPPPASEPPASAPPPPAYPGASPPPPPPQAYGAPPVPPYMVYQPPPTQMVYAMPPPPPPQYAVPAGYQLMQMQMPPGMPLPPGAPAPPRMHMPPPPPALYGMPPQPPSSLPLPPPPAPQQQRASPPAPPLQMPSLPPPPPRATPPPPPPSLPKPPGAAGALPPPPPHLARGGGLPPPPPGPPSLPMAPPPRPYGMPRPPPGQPQQMPPRPPPGMPPPPPPRQ